MLLARSLRVVLALLAACDGGANPRRRPAAEPTSAPPPLPATEPTTPRIPVGWSWTSAEEDVEISGLRRVADVDGDGGADVAVEVTGRRYLHGTWIVAGDLARDLVLPDDALVRVRDRVDLGDIDGDGVTDLYARGGWRVSGPLAGDVAPERDGVPAPADGELGDFDGDGRVDLHRTDLADLAADVWTDPHSWGADPPSLRVEPPCGSYAYSYDGGWSALRRFADLDGDGAGELWLGGEYSAYGWEACSGIQFPMGRTGLYDPSLDPEARLHVPRFDAVGDQDGDGVGDVLVHDEGRVVAGPVAFVDGAVVGPTLLEPVTPGEPAPFDLDGDGIGEWILSPEDAAALVTSGGPDGGIATGAHLLRAGSPSSARAVGAWSAGRALVLVPRAARVEVHDLGAADPIPLPD